MSDDPANPRPTDALVVHRAERPRLTVHSWAREDGMHSAWPGDGVAVPPDGTRIEVKLIAFPIGQVREIYLDAGERTHPHDSYDDILFYQVGGRRLQVCGTDSWVLDPGDVSFEAHGSWHNTQQLIGGLFVEFALPAPRRADGFGMRIGAEAARRVPCAVWEEGDVLHAAEGADAHWAPAHALRHERRVFSVPGHDLIETRLPAGARTAPRTAPHDTLFYVISGSLAATIGDVRIEAEEGASLRAPAHTPYAFAASADTVLIEAAARAL